MQERSRSTTIVVLTLVENIPPSAGGHIPNSAFAMLERKVSKGSDRVIIITVDVPSRF